MRFALLPWTRHLFQVYSIGQWRGNISLDFGNNSLDFGNNSSDFGNSWSVRKDGLEKAEADLNFIRTGQICEIRANAKRRYSTWYSTKVPVHATLGNENIILFHDA